MHKQKISTRVAKAMLSRMKLTDEAVAVVVAKNCQGIITIDDFAQLNKKSVEGLCLVPKISVGTTGEVYNPGVAVSAIAEANLQGMIYFIKHFKSIGPTCTQVDVELS